MCGLNAYLTSGAPQLLTVNISQQSLTWPVLSSLRVQQKKSLSSTTASHSGLRLCNCMTWLTSGYFHPVKRKRKSPKVLTKISDPSVLLNLLRLLIDQQSQKVCATIKGFVRRRAATKKGEELYLFGQKGGGSRGGAWQQEGGRRGGGGGDEEGGCLCTCVRVAPWETGRKQDLKLKQHPANPHPPSSPAPPPSQKCLCCFPAPLGRKWERDESVRGLCKDGTGGEAGESGEGYFLLVGLCSSTYKSSPADTHRFPLHSSFLFKSPLWERELIRSCFDEWKHDNGNTPYCLSNLKI